jgi:hypothetical protein
MRCAFRQTTYLRLAREELVQEGGQREALDGVARVHQRHACQQRARHGRHGRMCMLPQRRQLPTTRHLPETRPIQSSPIQCLLLHVRATSGDERPTFTLGSKSYRQRVACAYGMAWIIHKAARWGPSYARSGEG